MTAILLAALQILLLLLKAFFNRDQDVEKSRQHIAEAQAKLAAIAEQFEQKNRYSNIDPASMDHFQDAMDEERKKNK